MKRITFFILAAVIFIFATASCTCSSNADATRPIKVGIAWRADFKSDFSSNAARAIKEAGAEPVLLGQVRPDGFEYDSVLIKACYLDENDVLLQEYADVVKNNTWHGTNAVEAIGDVDAVVFTGGEDIAPTLYNVPEPWHGIESEKNFNATRDISDYITMAYCIDNDIPVLGLCRGMQVLAVVSGCKMVQDIPAYYANEGKTYDYTHRMLPPEGKKRDYNPHDVTVTTHESLLYKIAGKDVVDGAPSWHHQGAICAEGTPILVSGVTEVDGITIFEALERPDKTFVLGVQYHPEAALCKHLDGKKSATSFMSQEDALGYFKALVEAATSRRSNK